MMRIEAAWLAIVAAALAPYPAAADKEAPIERPIIAGVVADSARYVGRRIEIYGLVVRTEGDGRRFHLQDVSQRPLLVVAPKGRAAVTGAQLIVSGVVRRVDGELRLAAETMTPARVTAGGGCC